MRVGTPDTDDIDAWWDSIDTEVTRLVLMSSQAVSFSAEAYLKAHAQANEVVLEAVRGWAPQEEIATSLRVTGPVRFKQAITEHGSVVMAVRLMVEAMASSAVRLMLAGDRNTAMSTFRNPANVDVSGWRRRVSANACSFCGMLASRGVVYTKSQSAANFRAHDSCKCSVEYIYSGQPEPESVVRLQSLWSAKGDDWRTVWDSMDTAGKMALIG